jgi:hypothetical protein
VVVLVAENVLPGEHILPTSISLSRKPIVTHKMLWDIWLGLFMSISRIYLSQVQKTNVE